MTPARQLHERILTARATHRSSFRDIAVGLAEFTREALLELGFASVFHYALRVLDLKTKRVREALRLGRSLPDLPVLDASIQRGDLGRCQARALMKVITPDNEAKWVDKAVGRTNRELEALVREVPVGGDPKEGEPDPEPGPSRVRMTFMGEASDNQLVRDAITALRAQLGSDGEELDDAALLALMAQRFLRDANLAEPASAERFRIVLEHCPSCRQTHSEGNEVRDTVHEMACCDSEVLEMRPGPKRGHLSRTVPPAVRRAVLQRDGGRCVVPGCECRLYVDLHHLRWRSRGGRHEEGNLAVLCSAHHKLLHDGYLAVAIEEGVVVVTNRRGRLTALAAGGSVAGGHDPRGSLGGRTAEARPVDRGIRGEGVTHMGR